MKRQNNEYNLCKAIAIYIRLKYPKVLFHFDYAGLNLSKAQAGRMKSIQGPKGFPDLFIAQKSFQGEYNGLFLEIKTEGTRLVKLNGEYSTPHIAEQSEMLRTLHQRGYKAEFAVGFNEAKRIIDEYLKG